MVLTLADEVGLTLTLTVTLTLTLTLLIADKVGSQLSSLDGEHLGILANGLATSKLRAEGTLQGIAVEVVLARYILLFLSIYGAYCWWRDMFIC